jgi:glycosyltransferase involved in cell wall biosynthesis
LESERLVAVKVLMIAPEPYFEPRGTPISVLQRLRALSGIGHSVDLVTYHVGEDYPVPGVTIHRIPRIPFVSRVEAGPSLAKLILDGFLFWRAFGRLCRERYHVLHTHEEASFFGMILAAIFRVRHVYDMHSSLPRQMENFGFGGSRLVVMLFEGLERAVLHSCAAVITIGEDLERRVREINPRVPVQRIDNLPVSFGMRAREESASVADLREDFRRKGYLPVVYTGTFEKYQGLEMLLESAGILAQHNHRMMFVLVGGKASQIRVLEEEARRRGIRDRVVFTGTISPEEALEYQRLAEILVSPRIQGTSVPLKIYSYLHAERPILATRVPAHTQVLSDEIALLVEPTAPALAEGLLRLAEDPALRQSLAKAATEFAKRRDQQANYTADLGTLYGDLFRPRALVDVAVRPTEN